MNDSNSRNDRVKERIETLTFLTVIALMMVTIVFFLLIAINIMPMGFHLGIHPILVSLTMVVWMMLMVRYVLFSFVNLFGDQPFPKTPKEALLQPIRAIPKEIKRDVLWVRWILTGKDYQ